ncbi:MAG: hypothetical protein ACYTXA_00885 [Nostoc sp.]
MDFYFILISVKQILTNRCQIVVVTYRHGIKSAYSRAFNILRLARSRAIAPTQQLAKAKPRVAKCATGCYWDYGVLY